MMNDTAIKNFAVWARRELVTEVGKRCLQYGVEPGADLQADAIDGRVLTTQEKRQRAKLLRSLGAEGYEPLVERAAYTWFNRLLAIRFMEVNDRLPSHVRVLSAPDGSFAPQVLQEAMDLPIDALDRVKAADLVRAGDDEALFRLVFLAQCAELAECMPAVFEPLDSELELLLPAGLLRQGSVVEQVVTAIPEDDWREGVEIVGWMYQYYVSERKDEVFASFKKGKKAERDAIAPATQLFTPNWIVRYLIENSLGRLWMLNKPESSLPERMRYYVRPDEGTEAEFRRIASPEEITVVDPACGSGHILVYAFELLAALYEEAGYTGRDAARLILEKNLSGMEIDPRAASLASFALTMKACELDSRFLRRGVNPRITVLARVEFSEEELALCPSLAANAALVDAAAHLDECGSLLRVSAADIGEVAEDAAALAEGLASSAGGGSLFAASAREKLTRLQMELEPLAARYDVVVANPPYMGSSSLGKWMGAWVKGEYPEAYRDLCTSFIMRGFSLAGDKGYSSMVTMQSWIFLGSFEKMRSSILRSHSISSMAHLGTRAFGAIAGEVVSTTATVFANAKNDALGTYLRLVDMPSEEAKREGLLEALANPDCGWFYRTDADSFSAIPGSPIAYWASPATIAAFDNPPLGETTETHLGMATCDNERFLRLWFEVDDRLRATPSRYPYDQSYTWFPYNKGGLYRKWYGNDEYLVNWRNNGEELKARKAVTVDESLNFHAMVSWSRVSSAEPFEEGSLAYERFKPKGYLFDMTGPAAFGQEERLFESMAFLNSSVGAHIARFLSATIDFQPGQIAKYPLSKQIIEQTNVSRLARENIGLARQDWDAFETSWDFKRHPLV